MFLKPFGFRTFLPVPFLIKVVFITNSKPIALLGFWPDSMILYLRHTNGLVVELKMRGMLHPTFKVVITEIHLMIELLNELYQSIYRPVRHGPAIRVNTSIQWHCTIDPCQVQQLVIDCTIQFVHHSTNDFKVMLLPCVGIQRQKFFVQPFDHNCITSVEGQSELTI